MGFSPDGDWITTAEAGAITGRHPDNFRSAITFHRIPGRKTSDGLWLMPRHEVLAWHERANRFHQRPNAIYDKVTALLEEFGSADANEVSQLLDIHPGNARKHLAILAKQGRVHRRTDGQWQLGPPPDPTAEGVVAC